MAHDALNFFTPFHRLEPNHENQLTRALLVVLRFSPIAHSAWLRLVAPDRELRTLPVAAFDTQRRAVRQAEEADEPAELISVFLAPEEPLAGAGVVTESDRGQVLDAVVDYGGELLVVVENKVAESDDRQARELNVTGARVRIGDEQEAVVVLWRDVIEALFGIRERRLVGGAEMALLDDFLTYVEDQFSQLGPLRTLALCQGNSFRQHRRLRQVLGDAVVEEAIASQYGPYVNTPAPEMIGANAYLRMAGEGTVVELALHPADTLTQAKAFYSRPEAIDGLRALREQPGWQVFPNFHFGYMQKGFGGTCNRCDLDRYLELWAARIEHEGLVPRRQWDEYWAWLESERIVCPEDRPRFDQHFIHTKRPNASPRPGLSLFRHWTLEEAEELDSRGILAGDVRQALDAALTAFGEPPLPTLHDGADSMPQERPAV